MGKSNKVYVHSYLILFIIANVFVLIIRAIGNYIVGREEYAYRHFYGDSMKYDDQSWYYWLLVFLVIMIVVQGYYIIYKKPKYFNSSSIDTISIILLYLFVFVCIGIMVDNHSHEFLFRKRSVFFHAFTFPSLLMTIKYSMLGVDKESTGFKNLNLNEEIYTLRKLFNKGVIDKDVYDEKLKLLTEKKNKIKNQDKNNQGKKVLENSQDYKDLKLLYNKGVLSESEFNLEVEKLKKIYNTYK